MEKRDILAELATIEQAEMNQHAVAGAAGNTGDICWDASNIFVCVATNTWKKATIATW